MTYLNSSGLLNFFGFFGQQSQMNMPCIPGPAGFDTLSVVCTDIFRADAAF
jgi:hypothetical protein